MLAADDEEPETHRHPFSQEEHTHTHSAKTGTHASERGKEIHKGRHQASAVHLTWLPNSQKELLPVFVMELGVGPLEALWF